MLKGISPLISPELLKLLAEMGHGDEIVLADAHFPAASLGQRVVRADGLTIEPLLRAITALMPLDLYPRCKANSAITSLSVFDPEAQHYTQATSHVLHDVPAQQLKPAALLMAPVDDDAFAPEIGRSYETCLHETLGNSYCQGQPIAYVARSDFYRLAAEAYAIVATSDTAQYANIILRKGVVKA